MDEDTSSSESFNSDISISEDPLPSLVSTTEELSLTTSSASSASSADSTTTTTVSTTTTTTTGRDQATKQGYIEIREYTKKTKRLDKWKLNWCFLDGGSLFLYKNYEKAEPYMTIELQSLEVLDEKHHNRQFSMAIKSDGGPTKWLACCTALELAAWREALVQARAAPPAPVPARRPPAPFRSDSSLYRIKKSVAGRAATSKMGEVLLMKMFGDEIHHLFMNVRRIITKHHDKATASRVHKIIIRITIKIAFLFEKKILSVASLTEVDRPLREALELLSKFYNARVRRLPKAIPVEETFARIEKLSKIAEEELIRKIQPYISPKNLANIQYLFETVATAPFLRKVFSDPDLYDELDELDDVITAYTQVHI